MQLLHEVNLWVVLTLRDSRAVANDYLAFLLRIQLTFQLDSGS